MYDKNATPVIKYNPNKLLNALMDMLQIKTDATLARVLDVGGPVISNIRHRRLPIGASMLIKMHEVSNMPIKDLRALMGDRRPHFKNNAALHRQNAVSWAVGWR